MNTNKYDKYKMRVIKDEGVDFEKWNIIRGTGNNQSILGIYFNKEDAYTGLSAFQELAITELIKEIE
jgi:hypothetical protein